MRHVLIYAVALCGWAAAHLSPALAEEERKTDGISMASAGLLTGIDVLERAAFAPLDGLRIGLLTHIAGRTRDGRRSIDVLAKAANVRLVALFSPEHGLAADREGEVPGATETATRLPVYSLYGAAKRPTPEMLRGLDAVVIDLQDVGVRFYTYATTMAYVLEEAAKARVKVIVLDRPNPIGAAGISGPVLDRELQSFVGYFATPLQHGMTMGELARLFNGENRIGADLEVIAMRGYARASWYDETGLSWIGPSPNLRRLAGTVLYPGIGMLEFTNISVGRGTSAPFERIGAPWIDGKALASHLARRRIPGVRIEAVEFTPKSSSFAGQRCFGVRFVVDNRKTFDAVRLGMEIAVALKRLHGDSYQHRDLARLLGSRQAVAAVAAGKDPIAIAARWQPAQQIFLRTRAPYLLY